MDYYSYEDNLFTVKNYNQLSPFSNFLPGVAGKMGIPLWVFYINRGQGISGYGLQDKNHPIMAFTPANKAYENAPTTGFRTFIKANGKIHEAFHVDETDSHKMKIDYASFSIEQTLKALNLKIKVTYFGLVNEPLGGLVRQVELTNLNDGSVDLELLDGIAEILPSGIQNAAFKTSSNILSSWADVKHLETNLPFFTLRASTGDTSEVKKQSDGNFYFGFSQGELIQPIVDPYIIFGENTAKTKANGFEQHSIKGLLKQKQVTANKFACAFLPIQGQLAKGETMTWFAISGHASDFSILENYAKDALKEEYGEKKLEEAQQVIDDMLKDVETHSSYPIFDQYIKQNYLDNILRGGYPEAIGNTIYHLYSRRHGDLERDYNFFSLAPEYYSQGNGNFRDVCQNRRLDSFFNRSVKAFNIQHFASLIQLDGYNPLSINGILYQLKPSVDRKVLIKELFDQANGQLDALFDQPFTPGTIVNFIEKHKIQTKVTTKEYLDKIIKHSEPSIQAVFGEGFWIDHFTYVLDLIEAYEGIYPDNMKTLLFEEEEYLYFDSPVSIHKKKDKIVKNDEGNIRQYGSLIHFDEEKMKKLNIDPHHPYWAKWNDQTYRSNLYIKLLILVMTKHSLLDPDGIGIEMEAEKPGWNDAMNGLPGLLGSGVSESIELLRIIDFLMKYSDDETIILPSEIHDLFNQLNQSLTYEQRVEIRETYRDHIRFGLKGEKTSLNVQKVHKYLENLKEEISRSISLLLDESKDHIIPTFLQYQVQKYDLQEDKDGKMKLHQGYPLVIPQGYQRLALTPFLEAPARLLKVLDDQDRLKAMHKAIKSSDLYDHQLKMYKTSGDLNQETHEIGRIHAFTKGWLERESNFLHMSYKYLLGLLKAGLYDSFFEEIKTNLVCFMDPSIYKRSTLENSSFLATSNNPDATIHGKGYFARLSGSTVEALNIWTLMMTGGQPFNEVEGELQLNFQPKLHASFFKEGRVSFKFLKDITVNYIADEVCHTYDKFQVRKFEVMNEEETIEIHDSVIKGDLASKIRDGHYKTLNIYIN